MLTAPIQVTDFDVLATELPGQEYVLWDDYNNKKHIGNNRLNVLVDIHTESFRINNSTNNQAECDKIIEMIQDATFGKKDELTCIPGGDCSKYQGRCLVKEMSTFCDPDTSHDDSTGWRELDENSCKRLVVQTIMARIEEINKDCFEPLDALSAEPMDVLSDLNLGMEGSFLAPPLRRSRSASNMSLDAKNAFAELFNCHELQEEDPFEPLPITSSTSLNEINLDAFCNEMNSRKKRGRRSSLLRRSNSFGSLFDKKKQPCQHNHVFPTSRRSSKLQPSFIRSYGATPNLVSSADNSALPEVVSSGPQMSEVVVSTYQGMDIVLQSDHKTLNSCKTIIGNNRLRILLELESGRFNLLPPAEKQNTVTNLLRTITEKWKGRMLAEDGTSYRILSHSEATGAIYNLLLEGNKNCSGKNGHQGFAASTTPPSSYASSTSTPPKTSSLLAAAPPLPDFLKDASKEILRSGKKKYSNQMTERDRQAAAIEALKERNKSRQLAKEKAQNSE